MLKSSIIGFIAVLLLLISVYTYATPSREYWEKVGPTWDKLLNPCSYEVCN